MYNTMLSAVNNHQSGAAKEQTAFRFDSQLLQRMKIRAKQQGKSVNKYVSDLIERDLMESETFPCAVLTEADLAFVKQFAGKMTCPTEEELQADPRLERIWKR